MKIAIVFQNGTRFSQLFNSTYDAWKYVTTRCWEREVFLVYA